MSDEHEIIELVIKYLTMEATPTEIERLENWAAASERNRIWLNRFYSKEWVESRLQLYRAFDPEENRQAVWNMIETQQKKTLVIKMLEIKDNLIQAFYKLPEKMNVIKEFLVQKFYRFPVATVIGLFVFVIGIFWANLVLPTKSTVIVLTESNKKTIQPSSVGISTPEDYSSSKNSKVPKAPVQSNNGYRPPIASPYKKDSPINNNGQLRKDPFQTNNKNQSSDSPPFEEDSAINNDEDSETPDQNNNRYQANYASAGDQMTQKARDHKISLPQGGFLDNRPLPDRSKYWLNAASSIEFPNGFEETERRVKVSGEAYFEVRGQNNKPFVIKLNGITTKSRGGSFNVRAYEEEDQIKITAINEELEVIAGPETVKLTVGQSAVFIKKTKELKVVQDGIEKVTSWKNRKFIFKGEDALFVSRELARRYALKVQFECMLNKLIFYEGLRSMKRKDIIVAIMKENDIYMDIQGKTLIVKDKPLLPVK